MRTRLNNEPFPFLAAKTRSLMERSVVCNDIICNTTGYIAIFGGVLRARRRIGGFDGHRIIRRCIRVCICDNLAYETHTQTPKKMTSKGSKRALTFRFAKITGCIMRDRWLG